MSTVSLSSVDNTAVTARLHQNRQKVGHQLTNLARAIDKGPFVHGLRRWVVPTVLGSSAVWVATAAMNAKPEERQKKFIQYGLSALGTVTAAIIGFKFILKPDPNTVGAIGRHAIEALGEHLPKKQLEKLAGDIGDLLEKAPKDLGLPHLQDAKGKHNLEKALEEVDKADELVKIFDQLNLPLGEFKKTLWNYAKKAEATHGKGISAREFQNFRNETLRHILKSHKVTISPEIEHALQDFPGTAIKMRGVKKLRHALEDLVGKIDDWQDDIAELASEKAKKGWDKVRLAAYGRAEKAKQLLNVVVDGPGEISSKEMIEEIWELSAMGALPVLGGILGGTLGDMATGENWRNTLVPKLKEGAFQYLANIMLCNVGAMAFIGVTEKLAGSSNKAIREWASKVSTRIGAMTAGILAVGVIGGSAIANFFGENFLNPLFDGGWNTMTEHLKERWADGGIKGLFHGLYEHRVPEPLDVMLHIDDFATGAAISGLSFVEPFLALFYTLSGIRAGIGYRNQEDDEETSEAARANNQNNESPPASALPLSARALPTHAFSAENYANLPNSYRFTPATSQPTAFSSPTTATPAHYSYSA